MEYGTSEVEPRLTELRQEFLAFLQEREGGPAVSGGWVFVADERGSVCRVRFRAYRGDRGLLEPRRGKLRMEACYRRLVEYTEHVAQMHAYHAQRERAYTHALAVQRALPELPGYAITVASAGTGGGLLDVRIDAPNLVEADVVALISALPRRGAH